MYDWLAAALQDNGTVITANRRLARVLQEEFAGQQLAAGALAWRSPAILSFTDWLDVMLDMASEQQQLPTRLNQHHSTLLWERCLRVELPDGATGIGNLVRLARDTWQTLADWQVGIRDVARFAGSDDQWTFASAAGRYLAILEGERWVDDAGLTALLLELMESRRIEPSGRFTFAGFDRNRPAHEALRASLADSGCEVQDAPEANTATQCSLHVCESTDAEYRSAGAWARAQLERNPESKVAIVAGDLSRDAERIGGLVREGLMPGYRLSTDVPAGALNVSYGRRLGAYPLVSIGLLWLRWLVRDLRAADVGQLLRSPLLGVAETSGRARLELHVRGLPDRDWAPSMITAALHGRDETPDSVDWLKRVAELTKLRRELPPSATPAEWAMQFDAVLRNAGWPGEASLSSADFQLVNRWRDLLNDLARIDLVSPRLSLQAALNQLESMAAESVFQPEAEKTRIHLLGTLEASGHEFDAIWLAGMTASNWPPGRRATPLVSRRLQEERNMPDAVPADTVAYARRLLRHLYGSAPNVVCSYAEFDDDAEQTPSTLLDDFPVVDGDTPSDPGWHAARLVQPDKLLIAEDPVPPINGEERLTGGASTIQAQLSDPITAFIGGRLGVRVLDVQANGLPPLLRGNLIHDALYKLYFDLPTRDAISTWDDLGARVETAVEFAFARHERHTDGVLRALLAMERTRVADLVQQFVALDVERTPFTVASVERKAELREAGVKVKLRIDRIDRVGDAGFAVIDYKTGAEKKFLNREREPVEYQLVAYACAIEEPVVALALANVDSRIVGFHGAGEGFDDSESWDDELAMWCAAVRSACAQIAAGDVRIDGRQSAADARPLNLLSRFTELRNE